MPTLPVLDSRMFFVEAGANGGGETPIVFLHGNPTSSHVWRNVIARVGPGRRCLAPDLIGMGRSGKPDIAYGFDDHARYLESWLDALALSSVVLVGYDWGGALAFDWAARHPHRVRGIAFMETIVRPMTWEDFPGGARSRYESLRGAGTGEAKVLDENFFIEQALRLTSLKGINDTDLAVYAAPYPTRESRRPLLEWPRATPINGEPPDVVARVEAYDRWLATSSDIPKLLLTFDGPPGTLMIGPQMSLWCSQHIARLEIENCGAARHIVPEDQPDAIGTAIARWIDRHQLGTLR